MTCSSFMPDLKVNFAGIGLITPVVTSSGTFSARESGEFYDIERVGAVITKGVAPVPWPGNQTPRIAESYGGMLNSVGLENPGVHEFIRHELDYLKKLSVPVIANVAGHCIDDYCDVVEKLNSTDISMYEINISCPNVKEGGMSFGTDPKMAARVVKAVKAVAVKPVMIKLSPNVTDIVEIAKAAEYEGADAISLINTLLGMKIDVYRKRPVLANIFGGLSGPAIMPVALRMVYQVRRAVSLPILGGGGIMTGEDAVEFLMAGADAVSVGTAALVNPTAPVDIIDELESFMIKEGYRSIEDIRQAFQS